MKVLQMVPNHRILQAVQPLDGAARSRDWVTHPDVMKRLGRIEYALEVQQLKKAMAEVDKNQAEAMASLMEQLGKVPEAVLQAGAVIVAKTQTEDGPVVYGCTLTLEEMMEFERSPGLVRDPAAMVSFITERRGEAPHRSGPEPSVPGDARQIEAPSLADGDDYIRDEEG